MAEFIFQILHYCDFAEQGRIIPFLMPFESLRSCIIFYYIFDLLMSQRNKGWLQSASLSINGCSEVTGHFANAYSILHIQVQRNKLECRGKVHLFQ